MQKWKKYAGLETDFTKSVAKYLDHLKVLYTHVPNELKANIRFSKSGAAYSPTGNKLKQMGKKAGVPDILIFEPRGQYNGLAIELKCGYNKPSPEQEWWLTGLQMRNWLTLWSNSLDEVMYTIENYLK